MFAAVRRATPALRRCLASSTALPSSAAPLAGQLMLSATSACGGGDRARGAVGLAEPWVRCGRMPPGSTMGAPAQRTRTDSRGSHGDAAAPQPLTMESLTRIHSELVASLDTERLAHELQAIARLPDHPAVCLQQKWTQGYLAALPERFQVLASHGYEPNAAGLADFHADTARLLRAGSFDESAQLTMLTAPACALAKRLFPSRDCAPLSLGEMDTLMRRLLHELQSESTWMDVEDLAASHGDDQATLRSQLAVLKAEATLHAIDAHGLEQVEGWVRVMACSQMWAVLADRQLVSEFAAINLKMNTRLGLVQQQ